ncbi:MAG: RNA polymerase sigma factor [Bacteriovoracia bacterium]
MKGTEEKRRVVDPPLMAAIAAARQGDQSAFGEVIELSQTRLFRFLVYLCGKPDLAQDLAQETYVKLWNNLKKLKEPEKFWSWLFKMAKNLFIDHVRAAKNSDSYTPIEEADHLLTDLSAGQRDVTLEIQTVLAQLKPEERSLILLIYFEEHTCAEVADILGISENAVWTRLHRVRQEFESKYSKSQLIKNQERISKRPTSGSMGGD